MGDKGNMILQQKCLHELINNALESLKCSNTIKFIHLFVQK